MTLAIDGGSTLRSAPWPSWPIWDEREEQALLAVLRSGDWGSLTGDWVANFAKKYAASQRAEFCVPVTSGTSALEAILEAMDIGAGDQVITSAWTFMATAAAIIAVGATPVFVDIESQSLGLNPEAVEAAITARTRVIMPAYIGGIPSDLDALLEIGKRHGVPVIEDACQAWGSAWKGTPVGAIGAAGAFSFQASKNMTAGEGGAAITNSREIYERLCMVQNSGRRPDAGIWEQAGYGRNLRMTSFQAAVLSVQLDRMQEHAVIRQRNVEMLCNALHDVPGIRPVTGDDRVTACSWHLFQVRYDPAPFGGKSRDDFLTAMNAEGVPCMAGYQPLNRHQALIARGADVSAQTPEADAAAWDVVWFEQSLLLDENAMDIAKAIGKIQTAWN